VENEQSNRLDRNEVHPPDGYDGRREIEGKEVKTTKLTWVVNGYYAGRHDQTKTRSNFIGDEDIAVDSALRVGKRIEGAKEPGRRTVDSSHEKGTRRVATDSVHERKTREGGYGCQEERSRDVLARTQGHIESTCEGRRMMLEPAALAMPNSARRAATEPRNVEHETRAQRKGEVPYCTSKLDAGRSGEEDESRQNASQVKTRPTWRVGQYRINAAGIGTGHLKSNLMAGAYRKMAKETVADYVEGEIERRGGSVAMGVCKQMTYP